MPAALADFAELVPRLLQSLRRLAETGAPLQLPGLAGREWFELLERKLAPQLGRDAFLVVAVTGGTNIGKSVVFNHLAGFRASASSPLASGTKHPVCLAPEGFAGRVDLADLFPTFALRPWGEAGEALQDSEAHLLFWRTSSDVPANLLLLDTPDVDSDAPVNWQRADAIRQSADVLIAVLTQQKYNDAAVKQFFRKAAEEGKPAVIVFNQCELPDDEAYWPLWIKTFCRETGLEPLYIYLAPNDRKAAESITLGFLERTWDGGDREAAGATAESEPVASGSNPVKLQEVFARLRFDEIKLQSLRGALRVVGDEASGLPTYLREIAQRSGEFRAAAEVLTAHELAEVDDWPAPPAQLLVSEVRRWWAAHRQGWSAKVHGVYDTIGETVSVPFRWALEWAQGPQTPPWEIYRQGEWNAVVRAVGKVYTKLEWLADLGQPLLKARLEQRLTGVSRADLLRHLEAEHQHFDFAGLLGTTIAAELQSFRQENPQLFQWIQRVDEASAAARPMLTIVLGVTGIGLPVGEAAAQLASQGLIHGAMHVAGDVVAGTAAATVGESAISATASSGAGYIQAKFHRLQEAFTAQRARWLAGWLETELLGSLTAELQTAAGVTRTAAFEEVTELLQTWRKHL